MSVTRALNLKSFLLLFMLMWMGGCAGTLEHVDLDPKTVGYQAPVPKAGTRVVVWGNHSLAVDNASMWLHQRGLIVLDRTKLQQGLNDKGVRLTGSSKDWANILEAGKNIGADLVAFVEVSNIKEGQKFTLSQVRSAPTFSLTVEIRGVNPETGDIVTKSKAWQTGPAENSDFVIEDLTARALVGAWKSGTPEYKVLAFDGEEARDEVGLSQETFSQTNSQRVRAHDDERVMEKEEPASSLNQPAVEQTVGQSETSRGPHPGSTIRTENASRHHPVDRAAVEDRVASTRPNAVIELPKNNRPVQHAKKHPTVGSTTSEPTGLHREVDSTYLNGMETASSTEPPVRSESDSVGAQVASGALSILYTPVKLVYAGLGGIFGGLAYVLTGGDEATAHTIWTASVDGDYFLTPSHLRGDSSVQFMGSSQTKPVVNIQETESPYVAHSSEMKK
ncbi:MAG: hypothetical protein NPIRA02_33460 [Nitrospirales bacterium]|nr:MAG: hypothetical protein NPIRA02_33460 [Nitrospirales bacterium]